MHTVRTWTEAQFRILWTNLLLTTMLAHNILILILAIVTIIIIIIGIKVSVPPVSDPQPCGYTQKMGR